MAANEILLALRLQGQRAVQAGLKDTARSTTSIGDRARKAARGVAVLGLAGTATGKALYDIGATFDDAFDTIRVQTGATGQELGGLEQVFRDVVRNVPVDFATASDAVGQLNSRLGLTGRALENRSAQFLNLSRITKTDVGENIAAVTRLFGDWDVATDRQAGTLDKLFRAGQESGSSVADLSRKVVQFGAPLRQLGFGLDESVAMFASFEKAGVNVQTLMPGLKFALKSFLAEGKDPGKALIATFKGIKDGTLDTSKAFDIFGGRATPDMIEAIRQGRFDLGAMTKALRTGKDTIKGAADDTDDLSEAWQIFKNRAMLRIEPIAVKVFQVLGAGMNKLPGQIEPATNAIGDIVGFLYDNRAALIAVGGGLATYIALTKAHAAYTAIAAFATGGWTAAFWRLNAAMFANPVGLVILAIAALAAGFIYAYQKSETFRGIVQGAFGALKSGYGWVKENWPLLLAILTGPFGLAALAIQRNFDSIVGFIRDRINNIIDMLNAASGLLNKVLPGDPIGKIGRLGTPVPSGPTDRSAASQARARGGPVRAGRNYLVGEEGPELVQFGRSGRVIDAQTSAAMASSGGGDMAALISAIRALASRPIVVEADGRNLLRAHFGALSDEQAFA